MKTIELIALYAAFMPATSAFSQNNGHQHRHSHAAPVPTATQIALLSSEQIASYASLRSY